MRLLIGRLAAAAAGGAAAGAPVAGGGNVSNSTRLGGFGVAASMLASNVCIPAWRCTMRPGTCTPFMLR